MTNPLFNPVWPRWIADLHRLLGIRPQFILSGPIRDLFLTPLDDQYVLLPTLDCLWEALAMHGYQFLLVYDRIDGMRVHPALLRWVSRLRLRQEAWPWIHEDGL